MHRVADKDGIKKTCRGVRCLTPARAVLISYVNRSAAMSQHLFHTWNLSSAGLNVYMVLGYAADSVFRVSVVVKPLNPENAGLLHCHN